MLRKENKIPVLEKLEYLNEILDKYTEKRLYQNDKFLIRWEVEDFIINISTNKPENIELNIRIDESVIQIDLGPAVGLHEFTNEDLLERKEKITFLLELILTSEFSITAFGNNYFHITGKSKYVKEPYFVKYTRGIFNKEKEPSTKQYNPIIK